MKVILSVNSGSSSVKISVYTVEAKGSAPKHVAEAQINGLTAPPPQLSYERRRQGEGDFEVVHKDTDIEDEEMGTQAAAFDRILRELLADKELPQLAAKRDVAVVAHRIVHGGDADRPQHITAHTLHNLEALSDLAPLHNSPSLAIVRACMSSSLPSAFNVACFDTQFHASIPRHIRTYPIDQAVARANGLRKYGFHGLSYAFMARSAAAFLGKRSADDVNLIALHLGSGASACAIRLGRSYDTSMGLTPLAGLPGATRSGSVDPSLVFHYASDVGKLSPNSTKDLHISRAEEILNKEAGWKALTGTTNFGEICAGKERILQANGGEARDVDPESSEDAARSLAFDLFVDRVCGFVGTYYVALKGQVDALVFAGGIGERSALLRAAVVEQCACLGFSIDESKNSRKKLFENGDVADIGAPARHRVLVCKTDEQFEMARWCAQDESLWRSD